MIINVEKKKKGGLFRNMSLKPRLILFFVLLSAIPVLIVGIVTYLIFSNVVLNMAEENATNTIDLVCSDIDLLFEDASSLCELISNDLNMQGNLRRHFDSIQEQYSTDLRGDMELASISTYKKDIFGLYVIGENGGEYKSNYSSFQVEDHSQTAWYKRIIHSNEAEWFTPHEGSFVVRTSITDRFISVGIPFIDKASGKKNGVVLADIHEDNIISRVRQGLGQQGIILLLDENDNLLFSVSQEGEPLNSEKEQLVRTSVQKFFNSGKELSPGTSTLIPDKDNLIIFRPLGRSNWRIVGVIDKSVFTQQNDSITRAVALILTVVVIISMLGAVSASESISRPLRTLSELMEQVEDGDMAVQMADLPEDEIGRLGKSFNHMVFRIQALIDQIYQEQSKLRHSELKALQSQIRPHFLYNTLDSVTWLLRLGKIDEAINMLTALSTLFRVSLSKGREIITIEEELKHVNSYLLIESVVYSKKFDYSVETDPDLGDCLIPKLILQPLVENAINHGMTSKRNRMHIHVSVLDDKNGIHMSVKDTGVGIPAQELELLRNRLQAYRSSQGNNSGYGLYNVAFRIPLFFGDEYGLEVDSTYGEGTEVQIFIPKLRGEKKNA